MFSFYVKKPNIDAREDKMGDEGQSAKVKILHLEF